MMNNEYVFNEISERINKLIIEELIKESFDSEEHKLKKYFEKSIKYKDKFKISAINPLNYVEFALINKLIEKDIENGYIIHNNEKISLNKLDYVLYDKNYSDDPKNDCIIRIIKFKDEKKKESMYFPYKLNMNNIATITNLCNSNI